MMREKLALKTTQAIKEIWGKEVDPLNIQVQLTKKEFEGDYTVVTFPLAAHSGLNPVATAEELGRWLHDKMDEVMHFNVVKGFLNLTLRTGFWTDFLDHHWDDSSFGRAGRTATNPVVIEFSSPNTNKPLHLGHIRNNLLGWSLSQILEANGENVVKVNLVNDRGIHICKSMLAWQLWGDGETPDSSGKKGDHLVGDYYVRFDQEYKREVKELVANGTLEEEALTKAPLMMKARQMLQKWEAMDDDVFTLWKMMNSWVYKGFDETYHRLGVDFDKIYYESDTWVLGKDLVNQGLAKGVLQCKEDGSIWVDLIPEGLDEKLLIRADGTTVYITQDLGTAHQRVQEYDPKALIYVVGNEQEYHFNVLGKTLAKLGYEWADRIFHLSYGMVELPHGKMKSREGTVVDADDLMDEMERTAREMTQELGKTGNLEGDAAEELYRQIGLGALKFFILKVDPKKKMLFNPEESIDFNGHTGPFIQYTHARIKSLLSKANAQGNKMDEAFKDFDLALHPKERNLLIKLYEYPSAIRSAAESYSPALIANYVYELAQDYNGFYQEINILREEDAGLREFRLKLSAMVARTIASAMDLLGIEVPERM